MREPPPPNFCQWQTPAELYAQVEVARCSLGHDKFCNANAAKYLREAWVISKVGVLLGARGAHLSERDPPDGYLDTQDTGITPVEVTERLQVGRRRGNEVPLAIHHQSDIELTAAIERNRDWLEALIRRKLRGAERCPPNTVLLVYLNTSLYNFDPERTRAELEAAAKLRDKNIVGSLILYEGEIYGQALLPKRSGIPEPPTSPAGTFGE